MPDDLFHKGKYGKVIEYIRQEYCIFVRLKITRGDLDAVIGDDC